MLLHQFEQPRVHRGPDGSPVSGLARRLTGRVVDDLFTQPGHVVDRDDDLDVEHLADTGVDDRDRAGLAVGTEAPEESSDLFQWSLGGRQTDALHRGVGDAIEPLEAERHVCAALGGGQRVDLVDDHRFDAGQRLSHLRGEHEIQRLGRGDEQVGRVAGQTATLVLGSVAGTECDLGLVERSTESFGGETDTLQRAPQVLLDVDGERPQRRDVENARAAVLVFGSGHRGELVESPEEGGEGLARAGGGQDERVVAVGDLRPTLDLRSRRLDEGGGEPLGSGLAEPSERRVPLGSIPPFHHRTRVVNPSDSRRIGRRRISRSRRTK